MKLCKKVSLGAKPGREGDLLAVLEKMVAESKLEKGCLLYELYQEKENPTAFMIIETWACPEDLAAHKETAHFKAFVEQAPDLIGEKSSVEILSRPAMG